MLKIPIIDIAFKGREGKCAACSNTMLRTNAVFVDAGMGILFCGECWDFILEIACGDAPNTVFDAREELDGGVA